MPKPHSIFGYNTQDYLEYLPKKEDAKLISRNKNLPIVKLKPYNKKIKGKGSERNL